MHSRTILLIVVLCFVLLSPSQPPEALAAAPVSRLNSPISLDFDLVSEKGGWVIIDHSLYWIGTAGQYRRDITPPGLVDGASILAVHFLDDQQGWVVLGNDQGGNFTFQLARTCDGGNTWQVSSLSLFQPGSPESVASAAYLHFLDYKTGWLVIKRATSSNFSLGVLFKTTDGGDTWTQLPIPIGEPVVFITPAVGWTAGGASGNEIYRTADGGQTWKTQRLETIGPGETWYYHLPVFSSEQLGMLPVVVQRDSTVQIDLFATEDRGENWYMKHSVPLGDMVDPSASVPFALSSDSSALVVVDRNQFLQYSVSKDWSLHAGYVVPPNVVTLDMVTARIGWAETVSGYCEAVQEGDVRHCSLSTTLYVTDDGGRTWNPLTLPTLETSTIVYDQHRITGIEFIQAPGVRTQVIQGQGFDKCEIPTLAQLDAWFANSPYETVNLYFGGACRSCANSALTSSYMTQMSGQGWTFIPTWVGPQSACYGGSCTARISNDTDAAYNQGVSEANAAITAAISLGLAAPDGSGTIVYYDLEGYDTTNSACRNAAKAFISGWTARIHAVGSYAGVYGSSCSAAISDFATISDVPDAVWPAHWLLPAQYRPDATVWDVACLSNGLWVNHQRIRQYAGGHGETWGNVALTIDSNVIDGIVADIRIDTVPPTTSASLSGTVGENGWYRSSVQVTLSATDNTGGSGLKLIQYKIDDGTWHTYSGSFAVSGEGRHTVYYKAQDNAGNWEAEKQVAVKIDVTAPTGSLILAGGATSTPGVVVTISPSASDTTSGVGQMRLRDAGGTWSDWRSYATRLLWQLPATTGSTYSVEVQYKDTAGNISATYNDGISLNIYPNRPSSAGYRLARSTWGVAPWDRQSANYRLQGTAGQVSLVGRISSSNYGLISGFWLGTPPQLRVYLPLVLR